MTSPLSATVPPETSTATLQDRSGWPRLGLRGPSTPEWCAAAGLPFPNAVNGVATVPGLRIARLGRTELLILADAPDRAIPQPPAPMTSAHDGFRHETWAWFRLDGPGTSEAMAALTSADLRARAAPPGMVVQTRAAGLDVVLVIDGASGARAIDIFLDIAAADYFLAAVGDRCPAVRR